MNYTKFDMNSYNIHVIKTDCFKSVNMYVNFKRPAKKEEITIRQFLNAMLLESTEKYKSRRELSIACEELYNLDCYNSTSISGNYVVSIFNLNFLNEKYTEKGMLEKSIEFLAEIIFHPDVKNRAFNEQKFNLVKKMGQEVIEMSSESTGYYANQRMLEEMVPNEPMSFKRDGYLDDLEKITPTNLYEYYQSMISKDIVDIFICGNIDPDEVKKIISKNFPLNTLKRVKMGHYVEHKKFRLRSKSVKEVKNMKQSNLVIGCKIGSMDKFSRTYVGYVYNLLLGGGSDSKLFRNVREKNSLCYSISSRYQNVNAIMTISAGIEKEDYKKTVSLIKKQLKDMTQGKFSEEDLEKAKVIYVSGCKGLFDSPASINSTYISYVYLDSDPVEERIKQIAKVTKEDVVKFAKKVHLDTIFLLEGDYHE